MISQRVVVTGIGTVNPFGFGWKPLWQNILANQSAIRPIERFNTDDLHSNVAACIKDFDPLNFALGRRMAKNDLCAQYAAASLKLAFDDASLDLEKECKQDIGVIIGNCCGGATTLEQQMHKFFDRGQKATSPWSIPRIMSSSPASVCAQLFGLGGPNITINTACSSSINAIGLAYEMVQSGKFPMIVCGGTEAPIVPHLIAGFGAMGALAPKNDDENGVTCRPFDKKRTGFVLGEGCALLILESLEHALNRGANIYGEVVGYASFCDISHPVLPDMTGQEAARTMKYALDNAGIAPERIGYIHAHGTGTVANDVMETRGIKLAFEEAAYKIPISSSKGAVGHLLGGSGAIGVVMTALTLNYQTLPPSVNLEQPDCECDLDYIQEKPRNRKVEWAITNAFGFGGNNACLVLKNYESPI